MGRMDGKVVLVTGAARGQGRSHAVRLAEEGADIVAIDICHDVETIPYPMGTEDDLSTTVRQVEDLDRRIIARHADVRDSAALRSVVDEAVAEFGHIDVAVANAGINGVGTTWEFSDEEWQTMLDINLSGVWRTACSVIPQMIEQRSGCIIMTSSIGGIRGFAGFGHYSVAKHGVVGLMRVLTNELAGHNIRVNTVHPTTVNTDMVMNEMFDSVFGGHEEAWETFQSMHLLQVPHVEPVDISNAVLYLASDEARYCTGVTLPVDAGFLQKVG